ncbi:MAG: hypothetical protein ACLFUJ_10755 [Phycisphaerae bacterium]
MQVKQATFEELIGQLLGVLDCEIDLLKLRIRQLSQLSVVLAERDSKQTGTLLEQIEQTQDEQVNADARLARIRSDLAAALQFAGRKLKLGHLVEMMPGPIGLAIQYRRDRIIELAEQLQRENMQAAIMLSECVHLNRLLIQGLLPTSSEVNTYGNRGSQVWRSGAYLVDARG